MSVNVVNNSERLYWESKLSGVMHKVCFPCDFPVSKVEQITKDKYEFKVNGDTWAGLKRLCGGSDYKLHMVIAACVDILLYKYTGHEDIIIGSPIYRQDVDGNFINTALALRNNVSSNISFKELLLNVRETILEANEHQNYPVERLADNLGISYTGEEHPLFDVMLVINKIHDISYVKNISTNIAFEFITKDDELICYIQHNSLIYKQTTIERLALCLNEVFSAVSNNVNIQVKDICILPKSERSKILYDFNKCGEVGGEITLLHELFEVQAAKTPDSIALSAHGQEITYRKLNEKSNALARLLRDKGIGPNDIVGIMTEPSVDMGIGIMAILKAGAAYLPLDPSYPKDRLEFMLKDSKAKVVITQSNLTDLFDSYVEVINFEIADGLALPDYNLERVNAPEDLAYIIYTSGSTGNPKGVMVEHKSVTKTIDWRGQEYGMSNNDTILQLFSFSFDGFVTSFFTPLTRGARVVLPGAEDIRDPQVIRNVIANEGVTHFICVPALFVSIMDAIDPKEAAGLKIVTLAGDKVTNAMIKMGKEKNPDMELVNEYGPTENSVVSTIYRNMAVTESVSIGKPVVGTRIYILDKDDNLCPIGVSGEMCLSGERLARGYLNRNDLTNEKFTNDLLEDGKRMYRTGDLSRWREDGNIEFVGRKDYQVKIRGFRIELGEIEARLQEYPEITDAVVIDREHDNGNKYICAYFVSKKDITVSELREYISKRLPDYMIPSYFVRMEALPVTINGKADRKSLPEPDSAADTGVEYLAPRNEREAHILHIWQEVLGVNRIGINDNFFSLGGDSLKAIQVASRLSIDFDINVNDIFKYKNIRELAEKVVYGQDNLHEKIKNIKELIKSKAAVDIVDKEVDETDADEKYLYESYINENFKYEALDLNEKIEYKNILLTGATGFVGAYILREILTNTKSSVYLLVRGKSNEEALKRIISKLSFYFCDEFFEENKERLHVVKGDISEEFLGLSQDEYEKLTEEIDCVINSAAYVKHFGDYETFYNINVKGVERLINFSLKGRKKDLNHISTISVSAGQIGEKKRAIFTESDLDLGQIDENYYSKTKLEAEKLLKASENQLDIKIFRLGNVVFDSQTGKFQENIWDSGFYMLLRSFVKMQSFPDIRTEVFDFSYVDQAAKAVVLLFNRKNIQNNVFHIFNPKKLSLSRLSEMFGLKYQNISLKSAEAFIDFIFDNIQNDSVRMYAENILIHLGLMDSNQATEITALCDRTAIFLRKLGFDWDDLSSEYFNKMIDYCSKTKFL